MKLSAYEYARDIKVPNYKVPLFGTFDVENFGDCLFPLIVEHQLKKRLDKIRIYPFSPSNRLPRIGNYSRVYAFSELTKMFPEPPSCFIIGGGELIRTGYGPSLYPKYGKIVYPFSLKTWLLPIMTAKAWKCPSILNAVGMGSVFDEDFNELAETYLQDMDLCLVRDPYTAERLSKLNVESETVPDSAFSVRDILTSSEWANHYDKIAREFNLPERFLVVQGSFYGYHTQLAHAVSQTALHIGLPVVLLPICHYASDIESLKVMQKSLKKQGVKTYIVNRHLNTCQTASVLSRSVLFIGTSLHGAVTSLSFGKPAVSFNTVQKSKHLGVLSVVGLEICYVSDADEIEDRVSKLLQMPKNWFEKKIVQANMRINDYFDQISDIIKAEKCSSIPKDWRQDPATGEVRYEGMEDFQKITQLCQVKKREMSTLKRYMYLVVRRNYTISGYYDRLMFWLRNHGVISFKYTNLKNKE